MLSLWTDKWLNAANPNPDAEDSVQSRQVVVLYDPPTTEDSRLLARVTQLANGLQELAPQDATFKVQWEVWRNAYIQLGESAADLVWHDLAKDLSTQLTPRPGERLSPANQLIYEEALSLINEFTPQKPRFTFESSQRLSPKLRQLLRVLKSLTSNGHHFRAIIFGELFSFLVFLKYQHPICTVEKRATAVVLTEVIRSLSSSKLDPYLLDDTYQTHEIPHTASSDLKGFISNC